VSAIAAYLAELERELKTRRAPRARLLAEVSDHLRTSAAELAAAGVDAPAAEKEAVARFGAAALVARRFAHAVATTSARLALVWAATGWASYAVAAAFFVLAAPSWLADFPQGAPSMLALQVAAVALAVTAVRALRQRNELLIDELRLRLVANGVVIAAAAIAAAALCELLLALTRPAPAPWGDAAAVIAVYVVAALAALVGALVAVAAAARAGVLAALPRPHNEVAPAVAVLVDDVAAAAPRLRPIVAWLTARPLFACLATATLAFAAMTAVAVVDDGSGFSGAAATGLVEAAAVVLAYLTLGRALGLRAPRRRAAG
jgi:hypothetical protein